MANLLAYSELIKLLTLQATKISIRYVNMQNQRQGTFLTTHYLNNIKIKKLINQRDLNPRPLRHALLPLCHNDPPSLTYVSGLVTFRLVFTLVGLNLPIAPLPRLVGHAEELQRFGLLHPDMIRRRHNNVQSGSDATKNNNE